MDKVLLPHGACGNFAAPSYRQVLTGTLTLTVEVSEVPSEFLATILSPPRTAAWQAAINWATTNSAVAKGSSTRPAP